MKGGIRLPNDVTSVGYKKTGSFSFEQMFYSKENNFTGTEIEFIAAGLAYRYISSDYKQFVVCW